MPFLRFTRDKRGYENTFLVHTYRHRGRSHSRILYWFRTPPGVKVGRGPLDEDAILAIEENNPTLLFDWTKILKVRAGAVVAVEAQTAGHRHVRGRRGVAETGSWYARAASAVGEVGDAVRLRAPEADAPLPRRAAVSGEVVGEVPEVAETVTTGREIEEAPLNAVAALIGEEGLARVRARHAELLARISERVTDPVRLEELRSLAETLNPDTWVTDEEARQGLEDFERRYAELRSRLGKRRRRRSRRGGAGRRRPTSGVGRAPEGTREAGVSSGQGDSVAQDRPRQPGPDGES